MKERGFQEVEHNNNQADYYIEQIKSGKNFSLDELKSKAPKTNHINLDCNEMGNTPNISKPSLVDDKTDLQFSEGTSEFVIRPNPFHDSFTIDFSGNGNNPTEISIVNMQGVEVYKNLNLKATEHINLKEVPSGIYIISVKYPDEIISQKIIKGSSDTAR